MSVDTPLAKNPFELVEPVRDETIPSMDAPTLISLNLSLPAAPKGLPAAPASCKAFVDRKGPATMVACAKSDEAINAIDAAMAEADVARRDAALAGLESCTGAPPGLVHALRADLAPPECGDAMNAVVMKKMPADVPGAIQHALLGQAISAWALRTGLGMPKPPASKDKSELVKFIQTAIAPWLAAQIVLLRDTSLVGLKLTGYGKGMVGVEVGAAALRVVDEVRTAAIPAEWANDPELKDVYYGALDVALAPLKDLGRDASLVGLREFAALGALKDPRVDRARGLLSKLYGGRRIDALDSLVLPTLDAAAPKTASERLMTRLPTFHAAMLLVDSAAADESSLRSRLEQGLPPPLRTKLAAGGSPAAMRLYAIGRMMLAQRYWRAVDIDQSAFLAAKKAGDGADVKPLLATAIALRGGPESAAEMMRRPPGGKLGLGDVTAIDAFLAKEPPGPLAAMVAFNGARILDIAAPIDAGPGYWKDVAARYRKAASMTTEARRKASAEELAKAADTLADAAK